MCGIAGMVGPDPQHAVVRAMVHAQRHRGPDGEGMWSSPGVCLGHRRLKVLDLSEAGFQPMATPDGRYVIVYNGEVYNYQELRRALPSVSVRTQTDTEVVLHAYAAWGPACLDRFIGMYAFAIWDTQERRLFCARDRLGMKPLYYALLGEHVVFASEIRPLLAAGVEPSVNDGVLYDFLARDLYEHTDETFFSGIRQLPPGHWMIMQDGRPMTPRSYWDLSSDVTRVRVSQDPAEREEVFLALCDDAVTLHLRSDVPVGVALSGGVDSSALLSLLDRAHSDPTRLEAFSFTFGDSPYSERAFVEAMARQTGHPVHFIEMTPQAFADSAEQLCVSQEEPCAGLPIYAYWRCFQEARARGVIVMMDGSGMDEMLAGYDRCRPAFWADLSAGGQAEAFERELRASGVVTAEARRVALAQIQEAMACSSEGGRGQDLTTSTRHDCLNPEWVTTSRRPRRDFDRPFPDFLRNSLYRELRYVKLPRALRFRDRLSMAAGSELRPPFLDHRLVAYAFALPPEDRIHEGTTKAILRRALGRWLPETVRLASKRQVQTPQREWFRQDLRGWVRAHIDTSSFWQRGWVDRAKALEAMEAFFAGEGNNAFFLWQWINLEIWARVFLDRGVWGDGNPEQPRAQIEIAGSEMGRKIR